MRLFVPTALSTIILLTAGCGMDAGPETGAADLAITDVNVVDVAGGEILTGRTVRIRDGRIVSATIV